MYRVDGGEYAMGQICHFSMCLAQKTLNVNLKENMIENLNYKIQKKYSDRKTSYKSSHIKIFYFKVFVLSEYKT